MATSFDTDKFCQKNVINNTVHNQVSTKIMWITCISERVV